MRPIITTTILALTLAIAPVAKAQQADNQTTQAVEAMVAKLTQAVNQGDSKTAYRSSRLTLSASTSTAELPGPKWAS